MFLPVPPQLDRVTGGETIRPYEICRVLRAAGVPLKVVVYGSDSGDEAGFGGGNRWIRFVRRVAVARKILAQELTVAQAEGTTVWLYLKTPPELTGTGPFLSAAEPFYRLMDWFRTQGGKIWCNMHDLAPDHTLGILERCRASGAVARARALRRRARREVPLQRRMLQAADLITVVSYGMADKLRARYAPSAPVTVFVAGVNRQLIDAIPAWCPPVKEPWTLAYVGSGNDAVLASLREELQVLDARNFRMLLGGRDTATSIEVLQQALPVETLPSPGYSGFATVAQQVDLWLVPRGDDPYLDLSWQLKLPMYLASGRPLLASATTETLHHREAEYMMLWKSGQLASLIGKARENPEEAARQARAARKWVLEHATWQQQLAAALQPMLDQK